jgi:hypothetical protein
LQKNKLKIEINDQTIEDPQILAEEFNKFFVEKVEKLAARIKRSNINQYLPVLRGPVLSVSYRNRAHRTTLL